MLDGFVPTTPLTKMSPRGKLYALIVADADTKISQEPRASRPDKTVVGRNERGRVHKAAYEHYQHQVEKRWPETIIAREWDDLGEEMRTCWRVGFEAYAEKAEARIAELEHALDEEIEDLEVMAVVNDNGFNYRKGENRFNEGAAYVQRQLTKRLREIRAPDSASVSDTKTSGAQTSVREPSDASDTTTTPARGPEEADALSNKCAEQCGAPVDISGARCVNCIARLKRIWP